MKVLIARPMTAEIEVRARRDFDVEIRESNTPLTVSEMTHALQTFDIVVPTLGDRFNADVFAAVAAPQCKLLANFGVGYNHIDVSAARDAGIQVTNTPGAVTDATADIAMTLILMSARRAGEGERLVRAGEWSGWHPTQMLGQHVTGKSVGIVGMGRIGQAIARRCHFGFGMDVCYVARSEKDLDFEATRAPDLTAMAGMVDILVVAVPGAPETYHLINADILQSMKPSAHLINIARGEIVEESALVQALETGGIAGAGLDVYEFEPAVPESLRSLDNVTLLPHLGTATAEVRTNMGHMALDNVDAFSKGLALPNPV
ncbi:D-glycerate dehydrogenase [Phaeobacter gallaeciensis]|uniref:D-glycerate dehydrogenase n=2 Tax=Roseobacteraceae TaxID=2854170 RepID=A0A366X8D6_9RHOB|nr:MULTISPECIES: D-glycerate dehydrogenase [Roseobacteraceae]MBT3139591.1 D-glycerate dehydrogenase [Falsiruegeria litorea]MBT8169991.1 D-glycerate dehydrogenase [Falsiruegeria litorea]RBW58554.1 D-glycerate dehydrogenase [Phaeobacter gallaeciensis]